MPRSRAATALSPRAAARRIRNALPPAVQLGVAIVASYAIAHFVLGHDVPVLAITVCLSSLGFVRDARPRRVVETAAGLTAGIALAELLLVVAGTGWWQIGLAVTLALLVARGLNAPPPVAVGAATICALTLILPVPDGGPFERVIDGLVAGAVALLATALLPRDPERAALRDAGTLFDASRRALDDLEQALRRGEPKRSAAALERLRGTQHVLDDWRASADSAVAVARISPLLRGRRAALDRQQRVLEAMDLAVRSLRIIARRVEALVEDRRPRPVLAELLQAVGTAVDLVERSLRDPHASALAREDLLLVARRLDPRLLTPGEAITESMIVVLARPLVVDLLTATGVDADEARGELPRLP